MFMAHPPLSMSHDGRQYDWLLLKSTRQDEPGGQDIAAMGASEQAETGKQ